MGHCSLDSLTILLTFHGKLDNWKVRTYPGCKTLIQSLRVSSLSFQETFGIKDVWMASSMKSNFAKAVNCGTQEPSEDKNIL